MSEMWEIIPAKSHDHWLEVRDPEGWHSASVKWDGCIHYNRYYLHGEEGDYLHICDLDEEIQRLQELKEVAVNYYEGVGREWPGA